MRVFVTINCMRESIIFSKDDPTISDLHDEIVERYAINAEQHNICLRSLNSTTILYQLGYGDNTKLIENQEYIVYNRYDE